MGIGSAVAGDEVKVEGFPCIPQGREGRKEGMAFHQELQKQGTYSLYDDTGMSGGAGILVTWLSVVVLLLMIFGERSWDVFLGLALAVAAPDVGVNEEGLELWNLYIQDPICPRRLCVTLGMTLRYVMLDWKLLLFVPPLQ